MQTYGKFGWDLIRKLSGGEEKISKAILMECRIKKLNNLLLCVCVSLEYRQKICLKNEKGKFARSTINSYLHPRTIRHPPSNFYFILWSPERLQPTFSARGGDINSDG